MGVPLLIQLLFVALGLALLVGGGEALVKGAVALAHRLRIPPTLVGLTVVAMGTSLPELVVSLRAALIGASDLSVGNVVGSNIYNILLILSVAALIRPLRVKLSDARHDGPWMVFASLLFVGLGFNGDLSRLDGLIFITFMVGFLVNSIRRARAGGPQADAPEGTLGVARGLMAVALGIGLLVGGAEALIEGATGLARSAGISERVIGLTVLAVGTSLPELFASVVATYRGQDEIAIANVVGSNLFNILFILGVTSLLHPVAVNPTILGYDALVMSGVAFALVVRLWGGRSLGRITAGLGLGLGLAYTLSLA